MSFGNLFLAHNKILVLFFFFFGFLYLHCCLLRYTLSQVFELYIYALTPGASLLLSCLLKGQEAADRLSYLIPSKLFTFCIEGKWKVSFFCFIVAKRSMKLWAGEHEQPPAWDSSTPSTTHPSHGFVTF